ncbi:MAG: NAD(P)/FAD-dependent oxidoreductase [Lachnospira eligens]
MIMHRSVRVVSDVSELNDNLESVNNPGIFFAGELVDIDGKCGGYNLQWAWSSGVVAAKSVFDYCNRQE